MEYFPHHVDYLLSLGFETHDLNRDVDKMTTTKKFDAVVSNPPYNDEHNSGNALWSEFIKISDTLVDDKTGVMAFIVPGRWVLPGINIKRGKIRIWDDYIAANNTTIINQGQCGDHFQGVGSDPDYFSYFIYDKGAYTGCTNVVNRSGNFVIDTRETSWLPYKNATPMSIQITKKIGQKQEASFDIAWKYEHKGEKLESEGKYPVFTGNNDNGPVFKYSDTKCELQDVPKIMFKLGRFLSYDKRYYIDYQGGIGYNSAYVCEISPDVNYDYIFSKVYRFLASCLFTGSEITAEGYRTFPVLPNKSKAWTDKEIYEYFEFTAEEIEYIESNS